MEELSTCLSAAALPRYYYEGDYVQLKLSYSSFAPFLLFFVEWMDYHCTDSLPSYLGLLHIIIYKVVHIDEISSISSDNRKATLREFYAVMYPSLEQLEDYIKESMVENNISTKTIKEIDEKNKRCIKDIEEDDECGICMEVCSKIVLPNCGHSLCDSCFYDWNMRSQSCPFCRDSLKSVNSTDLWILTSKIDAMDIFTLAKENLRNFFSYIENLPLEVPKAHLFIYDYLI